MSQVSAVIKRVIRFILDTICWAIGLFYPDEIGYLPPIKDPLLLESASCLARKIKTGQVSYIHAKLIFEALSNFVSSSSQNK